MSSARICIVLGKCCSGKDTFAGKLRRTHLDIGSIVRQIKQTDIRIYDDTLDQTIMQTLQQHIDNCNTNLVITGIRQLTILQFLLEKYPDQSTLIYLEVPDDILKQRFAIRKSTKDVDITFEQVIQNDNKLGLDQVQQFIQLNQQQFLIIQNY